eukprot:s1277_g9.t1
MPARAETITCIPVPVRRKLKPIRAPEKQRTLKQALLASPLPEVVLCTVQVSCNPEVLILLTVGKTFYLRYSPTQGHHLEDADSAFVQWCFGWAARGVEKLQPEQLKLLVSNFEPQRPGRHPRAALLWPGCVRLCRESPVGALASVNLLPGFKMHASCDLDKHSLQCLDALAKDGAMDHIFENIESFVTEDALARLKQLVSDWGGKRQTPGATHASEDMQFDFMRALIHPLVEEGGLRRDAHCRVHGHPCQTVPDAAAAGFCLNVDFAGTFSEFVNLFVQPTEVPGSIFFRKGEDLGLEASKTKLQSLQMYTDIWRNYGQEPGRFIEVLVRSEPAASFRKARDGRADFGDASQPLLLGEEEIADGR